MRPSRFICLFIYLFKGKVIKSAGEREGEWVMQLQLGGMKWYNTLKKTLFGYICIVFKFRRYCIILGCQQSWVLESFNSQVLSADRIKSWSMKELFSFREKCLKYSTDSTKAYFGYVSWAFSFFHVWLFTLMYKPPPASNGTVFSWRKNLIFFW